MNDKDFMTYKQGYIDFLNRNGVSLTPSISFVKRRFPYVTFDEKEDSISLVFNGPQGFGKQSFFFSYSDFVAAYEDAKGNYKRLKEDRVSFIDLFLGENWNDMPKFACLGIVIFCFNLTPSLLRKVCQNHTLNLTLHPKMKHCQKFTSLLPLSDLNKYLKANHY